MLSQIKIIAAACVLALSGTAQAIGTWETTLLGRDINGNAVDGSSASAVFLYDTDLKITWLRDANYAKTSGYDSDGAMYWGPANTWANALVVGAYSGWRLPTSDSCLFYNCTNSEMGHLWYVDLGGGLTDGDFKNLQRGDAWYWSGTEWASLPEYYLSFRMGTGTQYPNWKSNFLYALAVRNGDVLAVPEPGTYALMLAGLVAMAVVARRGKQT